MTGAGHRPLHRNFLIIPREEGPLMESSTIGTQFDAWREASISALRYIIQGFASKPAPGLILIRSINGAQFLDQFQR
jgi:hypothetical protein